MGDYISREVLLSEIAADYGNWTVCNDTDESYRQGVKDNYDDTIRLINDIPAADVQPVKHGQWISHGGNSYECSNCHKMIYNAKDMREHAFCGTCGSNNGR